MSVSLRDKVADVLETELPWLREDLLELADKIIKVIPPPAALISKCATPTFSGGEAGLHITCDFCHTKLTEPGALLFGIPNEKEIMYVSKRHLCKFCYGKLTVPGNSEPKKHKHNYKYPGGLDSDICVECREPKPEETERQYPCVDCRKLRTKDEGGTTFAVCDECWEKKYKPTEQKEYCKGGHPQYIYKDGFRTDCATCGRPIPAEKKEPTCVDLDYNCTLGKFVEQIGIKLWQGMSMMKYVELKPTKQKEHTHGLGVCWCGYCGDHISLAGTGNCYQCGKPSSIVKPSKVM